jgi:hypothetical protein
MSGPSEGFMADAKSGALVPRNAGSTPDDLDTALRGVEGKVRKAIVTKIRQLVDRDPEAFVRNMRVLLNAGRSDD